MSFDNDDYFDLEAIKKRIAEKSKYYKNKFKKNSELADGLTEIVQRPTSYEVNQESIDNADFKVDIQSDNELESARKLYVKKIRSATYKKHVLKKNKRKYIKNDKPLLELEIRKVILDHPEFTTRDICIYLKCSYDRLRRWADKYLVTEELCATYGLEHGKSTYYDLLKHKSKQYQINLGKTTFRERQRKGRERYRINKRISDLNNNTFKYSSNFTVRDLVEFLIHHNLKENSCACCGYNTASLITKRTPLLIDHINENYSDFRIENLQFLCYNCFYMLVGNPTDIYPPRGLS